ncbi:hypothetical protein [Haladaptatus caseinilyticus]|uniref:hypothetical protein n=1 Tax=Haladaptatus caseinilyticus TaxID=2993314 RepID=UPI00224B9430|nr:hypothetical protein [Haladaptatus caseinilyticus]
MQLAITVSPDGRVERYWALKYSRGNTNNWLTQGMLLARTRRQVYTMKKAIRLLLAMSIVGALFAAGAAGTAAADDHHKKKWWNDKQEVDQEATAVVYQDQYVAQGNSNVQGAAVAVGVLGDADAVQYSEQENNNLQYGEAEAENEA